MKIEKVTSPDGTELLRIRPFRLFFGSVVPNWLMCRPEIQPGAKLCYGRLAQYEGKEGDCFVSVETLAGELGIGIRQARRYLQELENFQLIYRMPRTATTNTIIFLLHEWMPPESEWREGPDVASARAAEAKKAASRKTQEFRKVTLVTPGHACPGGRSKKAVEESQPSLLFPTGREAQEESQKLPASPSTDTAEPYPYPSEVKNQENAAEWPYINNCSGADAQRSRLAEAAARAAARTDAVERARAERRARATAKLGADGRASNLKGRTYPPGRRQQLKACETLWLDSLRSRWDDTLFATWGPKERGQVAHLLDRYSGVVVEQALRYVVDQWDSIKSRLFKGKGTFPSVGVVVAMHNILVPEAQLWSKIATIRQEYDQWFRDHPNDMVPPAELKERYDSARKDMEALGL